MINAEDVPRKIVISRKGFDSAAGGCASPIINGEMISLPIPEHNRFWRASHQGQACCEKHLRYQDLKTKEGKKIADLVTHLTKRKITGSDCVHLDPDIRPSLRNPADFALPLTFGQDGGSESELSNLDVGDLFLYFGWFREGQELGENAFACSRNGVDVHAIWGWLQIGEKLNLPTMLPRAKEIAKHHPHVSHHANRTPNCLYIARDMLTFIPDYEGAGAFSRFRYELCLSDTQAHLPPRRRLRSRWRLPQFFRTIHLTHHRLVDWEMHEGHIFGKGGAYPGQEFIFETKGHEAEVAEWLGSIFKRK